MSERYSITRHGHHIEVENDLSIIVVSRERLFIDGRLADERSFFWGPVRLHGELRDGEETSPITVEVSSGIFGDLTRCVLIEGGAEYPLTEESGARSAPVSKDRELLEAMRDNGGRITPAEVAMATSLSVRVADEALSELAGGGHLMVEREGGALVYVLPVSSGGKEMEGS